MRLIVPLAAPGSEVMTGKLHEYRLTWNDAPYILNDRNIVWKRPGIRRRER